jgi:hypothetical protein
MTGLPGYDAWKLRAPEDEPGSRYEHDCNDAECPDCGRCTACEAHQAWCIEPDWLATELGRVEA